MADGGQPMLWPTSKAIQTVSRALTLGISVFAVLGMPLEVLLRRRFSSFRTIYLPTAVSLASTGSSCCLPGSSHISRSACGARTTGSWGNG